ncbi:glycosyltransferase (plasmid) [Paracoccus liaowanqingii]|uniref:Glycosyltransferase n=1 Tax=Paracoccus liaowanqingii TaxID=2560053 RepID=A0A4Y5SVK9_9RHOB|nr:glycosyltransferase [Paracoccus liaowanqingii]QDA36784.1 glycosyltransferase [Paracoccus liaowanqingii]
MTTEFTINGRFLGQGMTGVQRYAHNVIRAVDAVMTAETMSARILAPTGVSDPGLGGLALVACGNLSGHLWEQIELPWLCRGRLLNLCNTAPAGKADQIVCIHDANVFVAPDSYGSAFRHLYKRLQPMIARRAARMTTVSQASARQLARHLPVRVSDIAVLPNGHEHALAWDPALARHAPGVVTRDRPFVLALGSRARHKNLQLLAQIAPALAEQDIDIVIAGGDGAIFVPDQNTASVPASNLIHIGRVSDHDLAWLMDRALCLCFPSWTEGFGLPVVEAMARNCAVISSDRASLPEVCGTAALMASPADPAAWVGHVTHLARTPALRTELAGRGREQVQLFSWASTAAGYLDLLSAPEGRPIPAAMTTSATPMSPPTDVAVIVATRGRPDVVTATVRHLLATQTISPAAMIVSCAEAGDAGDLVQMPGVTVVTGPPGLPAQRNTGLAALPQGIRTVVFFDDDFVADPGWLAAAVQIFRDESSVSALTGHVLADGIKGKGIAFPTAVQIVTNALAGGIPAWTEPFSPYGCNMAFRADAIQGHAFDERLVLYGWLEDRDFAAKLAHDGGRMARSSDLRGVHMGVKRGRVAGERLGYSQIVNPVYMLGKRTMSTGQVAGQIFRNLCSNVLRAPVPEPFIDRRGRLRGNLMALGDLIRGHLEPERAAKITTARKVS